MKFNVTTSFSLESEYSPDVGIDIDADDFSDNSYWSTPVIEADGGDITFTVEAANEDEAEDAANAVIYDGSEFEDGNGFTWVVSNTDHSIEAVEMSKETALAIIQRLLNRLLTEGVLTSEEREAFDVILQDV